MEKIACDLQSALVVRISLNLILFPRVCLRAMAGAGHDLQVRWESSGGVDAV